VTRAIEDNLASTDVGARIADHDEESVADSQLSFQAASYNKLAMRYKNGADPACP